MIPKSYIWGFWYSFAACSIWHSTSCITDNDIWGFTHFHNWKIKKSRNQYDQK